MQLQWHKCVGGGWCRLDTLDLSAIDAYGVFIVWRPGNGRASAVLYVGSGALRQEIEKCRRDPILGNAPDLRITWAKVDPHDVDAVAAYLYQQLRPLWGEVPQPVPVLPVNLPLRA